ncbi:MAG TPA: hypothetical protein VLA04_00350 [Verrucomicrobiae bacterium]|nr:hypothetical protein [Verrucomicrobiae bacterium]
MEPLQQPEGEFHHFQLVNQNGEVPLSISLLVHVNRAAAFGSPADLPPLSTDDVIALHDALRKFDGNFIKAFQKK